MYNMSTSISVTTVLLPHLLYLFIKYTAMVQVIDVWQKGKHFMTVYKYLKKIITTNL